MTKSILVITYKKNSMLTIIGCLALTGFYFLYSTSNRADLTFYLPLQKWINENKIKGKYIGVVLLIIGLTSAILYLGFGAGIFSYLTLLMLVSSLVVLIEPLRFLKFSILVVMMILSLLLEVYLK
ncbi:hypothetical protein KUL156_55080 [Alteromonas sp. KUL156]|uniref:DoxX-like family protein n=2 Tax=Flavobacteriaceae TaxID=49546 RepID=A0ABM7CF51_9FLAO|nr:hypothetical protein D6200_07470 [Tenacibaculum mesophilum]GFD73569.1 hypothetical protein KUL113_29890 [Tenacibaculum sp. KUL113]GFD97149.1 hypothetical protein KUL154_58820 [Alteromonas sp. KUL154]GFE02916.1 hypothetical protein KUL156_55080 [Alteromonas sp. KUL156]